MTRKKGFKHSEETKKKIMIGNKGKKLTQETKRKISEINKGKKLSEETKRKIGKKSKGRKHTKKTKMKMSESQKGNKNCLGRKHTEETKRKIGEAQKGERSHRWEGGISFGPYDQNFNRNFKKLIRERDNNICMLCQISRDKLNIALAVHHIDYQKINSCKENCISLCGSCHSKTNYHRKLWIKFFQELLKGEYGYKNEKV